MPITHIIYHIPGSKVGCTMDIANRAKQCPPGTKLMVLRRLRNSTNKKAAEVEWMLADKFGYKRGGNYQSNWSTNMTKEQRRAAASKGGKAGGPICAALGRAGFQTMPRSMRIKAGIKGGRSAARQRRSGFLQKGVASRAGTVSNVKPYKCDVCGLMGKGPGMIRYHFLNCKKRKL